MNVYRKFACYAIIQIQNVFSAHPSFAIFANKKIHFTQQKFFERNFEIIFGISIAATLNRPKLAILEVSVYFFFKCK